MKKNNYVLIPPNQYAGKQILFNSDRILLNAKNDCVLLFSKQAIGLSSAGTINIDSDSSCIINSPKIQLGLNAKEPILLGDKTVDVLKEILKYLGNLSEALGKMKAKIGEVDYDVTDINLPAKELKSVINQMEIKLESIKSKQNYTL